MSDQTVYRIIISDRAKHLLGSHLQYLAQVSPQAAAALKDQLLAAIRSLETMPHRCPFFNEAYIPANKYHKLLAENRYLILYQIKDTCVYVDYVLDCRQDYQWLLR